MRASTKICTIKMNIAEVRPLIRRVFISKTLNTANLVRKMYKTSITKPNETWNYRTIIASNGGRYRCRLRLWHEQNSIIANYKAIHSSSHELIIKIIFSEFVHIKAFPCSVTSGYFLVSSYQNEHRVRGIKKTCKGKGECWKICVCQLIFALF